MEWNNLSSVLDNGRSKPVNLGLGGLSGLLAGSQQQGSYVPMANWAGNGLARTSMVYMGNPNYISPYGFSEAMGEAFRRGNNQGMSFKAGRAAGNATQNALAKLSGLSSNYDNPFHRAWEGLVERRNRNIGDFDKGLNRYDQYDDGYTLA